MKGGDFVEINFIKQLCRFDELSIGTLTPNAIAIYYHLFMVNNRCGWREWFTESDLWIEQAVGIKRRETVLSAINLLKQKGFIDFERGGTHKPTKYKIIPLFNSANNSAFNSAFNSGIDSAFNSANNSAFTSDIPKHKQETKTKTNNKGAKRLDVFDASSETDEVKKALKDFADMRTKARSAMTDRAKEILLKKLNEMAGNDSALKVKLLEQSIERGWKTVYALKDGGGNDERRMGGENRESQGRTTETEREDSFREECRRADANQVYPWEIHKPA